MTMLLLAAIATATCTGPSGWAGADDEVRPLFADGRSAWVIVIGQDAPRPVRYAAEEFAATVKKVSGAALGIVDAQRRPRRNYVEISAEGNSLEDRFSWESEPGRISLWGNSPRSMLFAAYAYLRDELDCRWYWPGEDGEYLPKLGRFEVKAGKRDYAPTFAFREMSICSVWRHRHAPTERWFAKVFLNGGINSPEVQEDLGFIRRHSGHTITLPLDEKKRERLYAEHPEWFSLIGGKRDIKGIAGCWSNPEFTEYVVSNLVCGIRERKAEIACEFIADIVPRCQCEKCTADPDKSARYWNYYATLIEKIREQIPGQRFSGIAYQEYRPVPGVPVKYCDFVDYCQYNRCYYHRLGDPRCSMNARSMDEFRAWGRQAPLGLYGYEFDVFNEAYYLPMWEVVEDEMKTFAKMGLKRVKTELGVELPRLKEKRHPLKRAEVRQLAQRLVNYAWAMTAFDPTLTSETLLTDFCQHVYGPAAAEMKAYHEAMAAAWDGMTTHITYFGNPARGMAARFFTKELEEKGRSLLETAAKKSVNAPRASDQVALDRECFDQWVKTAESARKGGVELTLRERDGDAFNMVSWLGVKGKKNPYEKTRFKLYRGRKALHVLAECTQEDVATFDRGSAVNDKHNWGSASIEMFIDIGDGLCRQIAITPNGGVWDAKDGDLSWNSGAIAKTTYEADKWILDIELPYATLGAEPKAGVDWKLMLIRNSGGGKYKACGWPVNAHRDFSSAATIRFR